MSDRILVIAAHPDDELLGVGGTIAMRTRNGDEAFALILGEGQTSRWNQRSDAPSSLLRELHRDSLAAAEIIGYRDVLFKDLPDNRFDSVDLLDIVKHVEDVISELSPNVVYTHHGGDLNVDHRITFKAVLTATRPMVDESVRELYTFETLSATEWNLGSQSELFAPNVFCDISNTVDIKCKAMECYSTELCKYPHPRSIEGIRALAEYRGCTSGFICAEAFQLIRRLVP